MEFYSKKVTDIYWYPVEFKLTGDKISPLKTSILFNNGFNANIYDFLKNPQDIKINKKTGLVLTDFLSAKNVFADKELPKNSSDLLKIETPLKSTDSFVITLSAYQNKKIIRKSESKNFSNKDSLKILFDNKLNCVSLEAFDGSYLTCDQSNDLYFSSKISPPSDTQRFDFLLGKDNIVLFAYKSNFSKIVSISNNTFLKLIDISLTLNNVLPQNSILKFISYEKKQLSYDTIKNSYLSVYESSPLLSQKEINPTQKSYNEFYSQNYLAYFPYKNVYFNEETKKAEYVLQIHGLKNYQTSEYEYSRGINYVPGSNLIRRKYNNIFTGTNQEEGYENVCLGYTTNTYFKTN